MKNQKRPAFTLVELLAVIAIMAVLIVAALPYVGSYTLWAQATAEQRDAQTVSSAIARWIALSADTTGTATPYANMYGWTESVTGGRLNYPSAWTRGSTAAHIIEDLSRGWTVVPNSNNRDPFIDPNTSFTQLGLRIKIAFTSTRNWTVTGRTNQGLY